MIITFEPNVIRPLFLSRLLLLTSALEITIHDTKYKEKENMHIRITVSFELINIFIQVIFPNIISFYFGKNFNEVYPYKLKASKNEIFQLKRLIF